MGLSRRKAGPGAEAREEGEGHATSATPAGRGCRASGTHVTPITSGKILRRQWEPGCRDPKTEIQGAQPGFPFM